MRRLWSKLRRTPLKERIYQALKVLNMQHRRLQQLLARLQERDKELFNSCAMAKAWGDELHAVLYANELVELRKLTKTVMASSLAIEQVVLRLETIEQLGDAMVHLGPVVKIIQGLKGQLTNIIPEVAVELENVNNVLGSILIDIGEAKGAEVVASNEEALKVLQEAEVVAEQRLREKLPELPTPITEKLPVVASSSVSSGGRGFDLEERILQYIKDHGGELFISKCASDLNVTPQDVRRAIEKLASEGKIRTI